MRKQFTLATDPHVAEVGDVELHFVPEVYGDKFLDVYAELQKAQEGVGDAKDLSKLSGDKLRGLYKGMREFLAQLMTEESAAVFARFDVVVGGEVLADYRRSVEAEEHASRVGGQVVDRSLRLPDRVLVELFEWTVELYGGGNRPTGPSKGSARPSSRTGTRGKGSSPSKVSTSMRGASVPS
ncbi:hypothetical protein [Streptomyces sp. NPDC059063]|uniref:hypothetical protein n=1 Tax=Streptomyces sp. NPDC059063 TaxID=3346712 RepID=UPI0036769364